MFNKEQLARVGARLTYLQLKQEMTAIMTDYPGIEEDLGAMHVDSSGQVAIGGQVNIHTANNGDGQSAAAANGDATKHRVGRPRKSAKSSVGKRKKRVISAAGRKAIAIGQKKRWAAKKKLEKQQAAEG